MLSLAGGWGVCAAGHQPPCSTGAAMAFTAGSADRPLG